MDPPVEIKTAEIATAVRNSVERFISDFYFYEKFTSIWNLGRDRKD